ncbi:hypothetical protein LZ554_003990 [Drepanopeziza brunnea f. sp. 'monogermtubi']|nr:hypothetical protein LZ554_003990 [Drepanopeziza brunnea f. sp. 'monogermtubi']
MTERAFENRARSYFPTLTKMTKQMKSARDEMTSSNAKVDDIENLASYHCDGESFDEAQLRIQEKKKTAIEALQARSPLTAVARDNIGQALHTIQDFYSHSNWAELGNREPNLDLIRGVNMSAYTATFDERTCVGCEDLARPSGSHSIKPLPCGGFNCTGNTDGFWKVTSGYHHNEDRPLNGVPIPEYKCHHGGPTDNPAGPAVGMLSGTNPGINKDSLSCYWSPHSDLHTPAATLATEATEQFFDDIRDALDSDRLLRLLFGVPSVAFAIDTSANMASVIATVRDQAIDAAEALIGTDDEPGLYIVSPYNDVTTGPLTVTSDFEVFRSAINNLSTANGLKCPPLEVTGIKDAMDFMDQGSTLFIFTDAAVKEANQWVSMTADATMRRIEISVFKYDTGCGGGGKSWFGKREVEEADQVYREISAATGGQYHAGTSCDADNIAAHIKNTLAANSVSILRVASSLEAGPETFHVPVDSYTTSLTITLLAAGFNLTVTQPDGTPLTPDSAGVTWTTFSSGISVTVATPPPGTYIVGVVGVGSYALSCSGVSELHINSFQFAKMGGRKSHTGWFPLTGPPPHNQKIGAMAQVSEEAKTANFTFRAPSSEVLGTACMEAGNGEFGYPATNEFFAILTVPDQNFLVYVTGEDDMGFPYQRVVGAPVAPILATKPYPLSWEEASKLRDNENRPHNVTTTAMSRWSNDTTSLIHPDSTAAMEVYAPAPTDAYPTALPNVYPIPAPAETPSSAAPAGVPSPMAPPPPPYATTPSLPVPSAAGNTTSSSSLPGPKSPPATPSPPSQNSVTAAGNRQFSSPLIMGMGMGHVMLALALVVLVS